MSQLEKDIEAVLRTAREQRATKQASEQPPADAPPRSEIAEQLRKAAHDVSRTVYGVTSHDVIAALRGAK